MKPESVELAIGQRLAPLAVEVPAGVRRGAACACWETRGWVIHRGVVHLDVPEPIPAVEELEQLIRGVVAAAFNLRWTWLRGFAFGAVVRVPSPPWDIERVEQMIDTRNRLKGVFQWLVFECEEPRVSFGVHTWVEGYLSPVFRGLVNLQAMRFGECPVFTRDKGSFFTYAKKIAKLATPGLDGAYPDFRPGPST